MNELLNLGGNALRKAALNLEAKEFILSNKTLFQTLKKAANRYIGGETLEETLVKVIEQNKKGFKCSMEFMGESTKTEREANDATAEFVRITQEIKRLKLSSAIALDLSHIGLDVSKELCLNNLDAICREAVKSNIEVTISAEDVTRTDGIIEVYMKAQSDYQNLAITLQAYLYRTKDDFKDLIKAQGRIRMVKGAFQTPAGHSIPRGEELDEIYIGYVEQLIAQHHKCSIATHHHKIQQQAKLLIDKYKPSKDLYEFESLYGIQSEQLDALREAGYSSKVYFVYGKEWYLYLCNRIAEYPLNIFRALDDVVS
jgi:proline dehydrogenase